MKPQAYSELWAFTGTVTQHALEQFASSVAALSAGTKSPLAVLEQVLGAIVDHINTQHPDHDCTIDELLSDRAAAYGFSSVREFRLTLLKMIGERMVDLEFSRLSSAARN